MLLALAVLLIQPASLTANTPAQFAANSTDNFLNDDKVAPAKDDKAAQKTESRQAQAPAATPAPSSTPAPVFPAAVREDSASQKNAPAPVTQANLPAAQPMGSFLPGQLEAKRVNSTTGTFETTEESSSRVPNVGNGNAPASFKSTAYSPVREAGRIHGLPRKWLVLSGISHGAATFDAWSTRRVINNGTGYEMNPMLRPFANSNALFGAVQVAPVAFDFLALRMMRSQHAWVRKMWWVPQSASAAASIFGGVHNSMMH
jgi:hypothetical protein